MVQQPTQQQPAQQQTTPAQQQPAQMATHRFQTPAGHYSNSVDNVLAATHNLAAIPIQGNTAVEVEAMNAIAMLKTAVT